MTEFSLNHITKNFGFKAVLNDLSLEVMTGERAALVGRNGTGKSTILKLIAGMETPDRGEVSLRRGASVGFLEQIPRLRAPEATVRSVLLEPFADILETEALLRALEKEMEENPTDWENLTARYDDAMRRYTALGGYEMDARPARPHVQRAQRRAKNRRQSGGGRPARAGYFAAR